MQHVVVVVVALIPVACARPSAPPALDAIRLERHGHRMERIGNTLYAFGGYGHEESRATATTVAFELPGGPWRPRAPMGVARTFFGSGVVGGAIHAIGGTIERYDPATDRWRVVVDKPLLPASHLATAVVGSRIHILGGIPAERAGHFVFDAEAGTVERAPTPPGFEPGDHLHVAAAIVGRLHIVGGMGSNGLRDGHFVYEGGHWATCAAPPAPLFSKFAAVAVVGTELYIFSMHGSFAYEAQRDRWRTVAPLPETLVMPCAVAVDGQILVVGGTPVGGAPYAAHRYDPRADRWS